MRVSHLVQNVRVEKSWCTSQSAWFKVVRLVFNLGGYEDISMKKIELGYEKKTQPIKIVKFQLQSFIECMSHRCHMIQINRFAHMQLNRWTNRIINHFSSC